MAEGALARSVRGEVVGCRSHLSAHASHATEALRALASRRLPLATKAGRAWGCWWQDAGVSDTTTGPKPVAFTSAAGETVLPAPEPDAVQATAAALAGPHEGRRQALSAVAARWPRHLEAWAALAENASVPVDRYAFARVGYHRGLDALRAAGWRGSGYVRWVHEENRGFLRSLALLRAAADEIGEVDEAERCRLFLRQLDPEAPAGR